MKKTVTLMLFLASFFTTPQSVFSWDSTAAKLYPMAIGNIWSYNYKVFSGPGGCNNVTSELNYLTTITRDTIMPNSKKYFVFESSYLGTFYRRIDSVKMNVYQYSTSSGNECLYDSLLAVTNSTFSGCSILTQVTSYTTAFMFGANRRIRQSRPVPCGPGCSKTLLEGIGIYEDYTCLTSGNRTSLNGCIISGIQYGTIITGIALISSEVPEQFGLSQNYPNPFNPTTHIGFRIAEFGLVRLTIFDALGREVKTLVNQELLPGTYEVEFNGSNLPSGVYYYKLESGSFTETKRMVLIK